MTNITFSVDEKLYADMKKHSEIKWSEIFRSAIRDFLLKLETPKTITGNDLFKKIRISAKELNPELEEKRRQAQKSMESARIHEISKLESQNTGD